MPKVRIAFANFHKIIENNDQFGISEIEIIIPDNDDDALITLFKIGVYDEKSIICGSHPLDYALENGRYVLAKYLLENFYSPNMELNGYPIAYTSVMKYTHLQSANNLNTINFLIDQKADVTQTFPEVGSILTMFFRKNNIIHDCTHPRSSQDVTSALVIIKKIIDVKCDINHHPEYPSIYAYPPLWQLIDLLIDYKDNKIRKYNTAFCNELFRLLLDNGANPNILCSHKIKTRTLAGITIALKMTAHLLHTRFSEVNMEDSAISQLFDILLKHKSFNLEKIDSNGLTLLQSVFISFTNDDNSTDRFGLLYRSTGQKLPHYNNIIKNLVTAQADINKKIKKRPLLSLIVDEQERSKTQLIDVLIECKIDIHDTDPSGRDGICHIIEKSPSHINKIIGTYSPDLSTFPYLSVYMGDHTKPTTTNHITCIKRLICAKADVNTKTDMYDYPLVSLTSSYNAHLFGKKDTSILHKMLFLIRKSNIDVLKEANETIKITISATAQKKTRAIALEMTNSRKRSVQTQYNNYIQFLRQIKASIKTNLKNKLSQ